MGRSLFVRTVDEQIAALWALTDILMQRKLTDAERDALIRAVTEAITKK